MSCVPEYPEVITIELVFAEISTILFGVGDLPWLIITCGFNKWLAETCIFDKFDFLKNESHWMNILFYVTLFKST